MITKIAEIPRVHVGQSLESTNPRSDTSERANLAVKAKALLGYKPLLHEVSGHVSSEADIGVLGKALLSCDIEILDIGSVFEYQVHEAARRTREELNRLVSGGQVKRVFQWGFNAAAWAHTALKDYAEPVPEFVLNKAVQIKEACPDVTFYVHHLNDAKADPFLVAVLSEEVYFVEVWEEPRFEGRLTR